MAADEILKLSSTVQIALASGYLAYLIAYTGFRKDHTSSDIIFRTLAFGSVATLAMAWQPMGFVVQSLLALAATLAAGALWRKYISIFFRWLFRLTNVSWTDDIPSAWLSITASRTDLPVASLFVDTIDGRLLVCSDTRLFKDAAHGPCILGLDGSIAFYVTEEMRLDGSWVEHEQVSDFSSGYSITYLPGSAVKRVELRFWSKANGTDAVEAVQDEATE